MVGGNQTEPGGHAWPSVDQQINQEGCFELEKKQESFMPLQQLQKGDK